MVHVNSANTHQSLAHLVDMNVYFEGIEDLMVGCPNCKAKTLIKDC